MSSKYAVSSEYTVLLSDWYWSWTKVWLGVAARCPGKALWVRRCTQFHATAPLVSLYPCAQLKRGNSTKVRSCVKVEVAVLGSLSLMVLRVSVDVKQLWTWTFRTQKLCESRGGCPGLPVPSGPEGLCGRKATLNSGGTNGTDAFKLGHRSDHKRLWYCWLGSKHQPTN